MTGSLRDAGVRIITGISSRAGPRAALEPRTDEDALARRLILAKYQAPGAGDLESWGRSALPVAFDLDS